jgi:glycosyltransferase involved in cell wall biosynthesis
LTKDADTICGRRNEGVESVVSEQSLQNVLYITRIFPPSGGSAVQRPAKFVKYFRRSGWKSWVVTCTDYIPVRDDEMLAEIPADTPQFNAFSLEPDCISARLQQKSISSGWRKHLFQAVLKLYSLVYNRIAIPDRYIGWVPIALRVAGRLIKKNDIRVIYVQGQPPSSIIIGYVMKKKFNIPLVIDYIDPWTTPPGYYHFRNGFARFLEKTFLKGADCVVYCKKTIFENIMSDFKGLDPAKFLYLPLGYDPEDFAPSPHKQAHGRFRLVYTGKLTKKFCYSPLSLFKALRQLLDENKISPDTFEVVLAGLVSEEFLSAIAAYRLGGLVSHVGYRSHRECMGYIQSADALLLLIESEEGEMASASFAGSLPSKIFEYFNTGKPILAIIPPGFEHDLIQQANIGYFARPNDVSSVKYAVGKLYHSRFLNKSELRPNWELIQTFDVRNQTRELLSRFSELSRKGATG